ncbi:hypothetical protein NEDG_01910 [Nematocida displodere]|uniref:Uncharacterized protein n=1 Tax=Nematocida displodere TaxID=1805483 RepID=A0A177EHF3_9MICR|nr:hypothetical protein NEDG_01910 [Nematocida displodere]
MERILTPLGVHRAAMGEELTGTLVSTNGRCEWRFTAAASATVDDLCQELKAQTKIPSITTSWAAGKLRIIDLAQELYIIVEEKYVLFIERATIEILPRFADAPGTENKPIVSLKRVGVKQRVCGLCQHSVGIYKRKSDILICESVKQICSACHKEFHWAKANKKNYEGFHYDLNLI